MFAPTHNIMTFQRWKIAVCVCCVLGIGSVNTSSLVDGVVAYGRGDYAQAIKILKPLAEQGDASAQSILGIMYENGQGVTQNYQEAIRWFRLAAAQGWAGGQNGLGDMYYKGEGVTQNYQEAIRWYRLAAAQGNKRAKEFLKGLEMGEAAKSGQ